jgi:hypothetical protein
VAFACGCDGETLLGFDYFVAKEVNVRGHGAKRLRVSEGL